MFAHVEPLHIGFNMLALWILGPQLELVLGRVRFLALYLLSGLVGSAAVYWLSPEYTPTLGASGAIFGLMGALLVVARKVRADISQLMVWIGINAALTVLRPSGISWQGHLGGFVGGRRARRDPRLRAARASYDVAGRGFRAGRRPGGDRLRAPHRRAQLRAGHPQVWINLGITTLV